MTEIRFVTCSGKPFITSDDALAAEALRRHGIEATAEPWDGLLEGNGPAILRSPWNYHLKPADFLAWVANQQAPLWNHPDTVRWNLDKFYLRELEQRGCPIIPTVFLPRGAAAHLPTILRDSGWESAVVKPSVSATSYLTSIATQEALDSLLADHNVLVQKFMPEIQTDGELSLVFFNGLYSHAMRKNAAPGDFRIQEEYGGRTIAASPPPGVIEQAEQALSLTPNTPHLYARVDGIVSGTIFFIMEIELIEPCLYLATDRKAAARFAAAIAALLGSTLLIAQTRLLPVDESASDPQFAAFYKSFRTAVSQKDAKTLLNILDPEVQSEIDGDKGAKAFEKHWNPSDPASKLWMELATVTALGGSFSTEQGTKMFCAPYTYSKFPDAVDSFGHGVILGPSVQLRSGPSENAAVVAKLSHNIVKVPEWKASGGWVGVITNAGKGYVRATEIRSPSDFRVCFHRKGGRWMLRWLVAGD